MRRGLVTAMLATLVMLITTRNAYAYLDPGTGSMLLQGIIGGIAAGFAVISLYLSRIKAFIRSRFSSKQDTEAK